MKTCRDCAWIGRIRHKEDEDYSYCRRTAWGGVMFRRYNEDLQEALHTSMGVVFCNSEACPAFIPREDAK